MSLTTLIWENLPQYAWGSLMTLQLLLISISLGFVLAVLTALMKHSSSNFLSTPAKIFIFYFRGTPFLIQMFLIYYGSGQFEWIKNSFLWSFFQHAYFCALLALTLNNASYAAEMIYNSIVTSEKGEIEAAQSLGMSYLQMTKNIVLPSALRRIIPAYGNEVVFMLHATSLVSVITLVDITAVSSKIYQRYYTPFEAYTIGAVFYLIITSLITIVFKKLESKYYVHLTKRNSF